MAVTSIWSVKGHLGKVVLYAENPEKTQNPDLAGKQGMTEEGRQGLSDVIAYAVNEEKTKRRGNRRDKKETGRKAKGIDNREDEDKAETETEMPISDSELADEGEALLHQYVSGVNCSPAAAHMEMMAVKKRFGKEDGIVAFHGYQSFAPGECTPAMAHEIGVRLAEELWGSRFQVLVATHLDKASHLHNHFVVNSVSFIDGLKYHRTKQDYRKMRKASDRLCREYQLSVIEKDGPSRGKSYGEWKAEQEGKPTCKGLVREDVEDAIRKARTEKQFYQLLREKGYSIKFGKDITVRPEGRERGMKLARNFGEEYTMEAIRRRILMQAGERSEKSEKSVRNGGNGKNTETVPQEPPGYVRVQKAAAVVYRALSLPGKKLPGKKIYDVRIYGARRRVRKLTGLRGMYFRYCYLLGILPKNGKRRLPGQVHHLFREDLVRLDTIAKETRLLCHYRIDTAGQLSLLQEDLKVQMEELTGRRKTLRSQSRSIRDEEKLSLVKAEIKELTGQIKAVRKEVKLCAGIAARSGKIEERMERKEMIQQKKIKEKEADSHEHIRRCR